MKKRILASTKKQVFYKHKDVMIYSYLYSFDFNKFIVEIWDKENFILKIGGKNLKNLFNKVKKRFNLDITDFGYNY